MNSILLVALQGLAPSLPGAPAVDIAALLSELTDRRALAELPSPAWTCAQASSYDRASIAPDKNWFANADAGHFVRIESAGDRREGVMLDADGPGAVVRIWSATPAGTLRVYIDGAAKPVIEANMRSFLSGQAGVEPPLAAETARGFTSYLPIPYARHCKITCDAPEGLYYQVNHRRYAERTNVVSLTAAELRARWPEIDRAEKNWRDLARATPPGAVTFDFTLSEDIPEGSLVCAAPKECSGPRAVTEMALKFEAPDVTDALRKAILHMTFDGEETVRCPLGDFFGASPGLNPYECWPFSVTKNGELLSRWTMPYRESFSMSIDNRGSDKVHIAAAVRTVPWTWTERSMHFHAAWRAAHALKTRPMSDWTHVAIEGQGVFVGDMLTIGNPVKDWWGEGDEKIYVDGEVFPSHFGTGSEDYYGFGWSSPLSFQAPLHDQTRCDGPGNFGWTSVNRFRALDAIPFTKSLRFDMEIWHSKECAIERAATCWYYARPGAHDDAPPIRDEDLGISVFAMKVFRIPGAIEAETLPVASASTGLAYGPQDVDDNDSGAWSSGQHLWVRARKEYEFIELRIPVAKPGRREVVVYPTKSWDYGTLQFSVDGKQAGDPLVTFNTDARAVEAPKPHSLGTFDLGRELVLRIEVVGTHERSEAPHYFFGIDCVLIR